MESPSRHTPIRRAERWTAIALCAAVLAAAVLEPFVRKWSAGAGTFAPDWAPLAAGALGTAGFISSQSRPRWARVQQVLRWSGLALMAWAANGLPFDLLRMTRLIPLPVDWPGLATKTVAFAAAVVLAWLAVARLVPSASTRPATWYGYAAFVLALPYPVLRTCWALGGTLGLRWPGAGGHGWAPWLLAIPWLLAAALSLLLVPTWRWMPRRLMLTAGWCATAIVAMIGPTVFRSFISALVSGGDFNRVGIALWVFGLFYVSWFLWAIAAGAATRSYQLRTARTTNVIAEASA